MLRAAWLSSHEARQARRPTRAFVHVHLVGVDGPYDTPTPCSRAHSVHVMWMVRAADRRNLVVVPTRAWMFRSPRRSTRGECSSHACVDGPKIIKLEAAIDFAVPTRVRGCAGVRAVVRVHEPVVSTHAWMNREAPHTRRNANGRSYARGWADEVHPSFDQLRRFHATLRGCAVVRQSLKRAPEVVATRAWMCRARGESGPRSVVARRSHARVDVPRVRASWLSRFHARGWTAVRAMHRLWCAVVFPTRAWMCRRRPSGCGPRAHVVSMPAWMCQLPHQKFSSTWCRSHLRGCAVRWRFWLRATVAVVPTRAWMFRGSGAVDRNRRTSFPRVRRWADVVHAMG